MFEDSYRHKGLRRNLIRVIKEKGIADKNVLEAIGNVPRHFFFDSALVAHAYEDKAFPIGEGQTISQPYTVAFQTSLLNVKQGDKVLEIGTGSGYQAAVLMNMGVKLFTIEYNKTLFTKADYFFKTFNYNVKNFFGDGSQGLPLHAPYDKIIVTAGCPAVPQPLIDQLSEGGVLVIPVGDGQSQKMLRIIKRGESIIEKETFPNFSFVPLLGKYGWKK